MPIFIHIEKTLLINLTFPLKMKRLNHLFSGVIKGIHRFTISTRATSEKGLNALILKAFTINQNRGQGKQRRHSLRGDTPLNPADPWSPGKEGSGKARLCPETTPVRWAALRLSLRWRPRAPAPTAPSSPRPPLPGAARHRPAAYSRGGAQGGRPPAPLPPTPGRCEAAPRARRGGLAV